MRLSVLAFTLLGGLAQQGDERRLSQVVDDVGLVALLVKHSHALHHLGGQRAQRQRGVVLKELILIGLLVFRVCSC